MIVAINWASKLGQYVPIKLTVLDNRFPFMKINLPSSFDIGPIIRPENTVIYHQISIIGINWPSLLSMIIGKLAVIYHQISIPTINWPSILLCRVIIELTIIDFQITIIAKNWASIFCRVTIELATINFQITEIAINWTSTILYIIVIKLAICHDNFRPFDLNVRIINYRVIC